jgi:hypothetical protein
MIQSQNLMIQSYDSMIQSYDSGFLPQNSATVRFIRKESSGGMASFGI